MTNVVALKNLIEQRGIKISYICRETGICRTSLWKKMNGMTEFKQSEVAKISEVLGLKKREVDSIFFA